METFSVILHVVTDSIRADRSLLSGTELMASARRPWRTVDRVFLVFDALATNATPGQLATDLFLSIRKYTHLSTMSAMVGRLEMSLSGHSHQCSVLWLSFKKRSVSLGGNVRARKEHRVS